MSLAPSSRGRLNTDVCRSGFESTTRWTPLAAKTVDRIIEQDIEFLNYTPDNYAFFNDTLQPNDYNYMTPPSTITVNGVVNKNSQRYHVCSNLQLQDTIRRCLPGVTGYVPTVFV